MYSEGHNFMDIGMWLFWLVLIVIILLLVKTFASNNTSFTGKQNPMGILKERYARGEIDEKEFTRQKRELEN